LRYHQTPVRHAVSMSMCFPIKRIGVFLLTLLAIVVVAVAGRSSLAGAVRDAQTEVELVAQAQSVQPGGTVWVGVSFRPDPGWHVYWKNPGDSGLAPTIEWRLPDGWSVGEVRWPYPERIDQPPLTTYGYTDAVLLMVEVRAAEQVAAGGAATIGATVRWLACEVECVPGSAELTLELPVRSEPPQPDARWAPVFAAMRDRLPIATDEWMVSAAASPSVIRLQIASERLGVESLGAVQFFPEDAQLIRHAAAQRVARIDGGVALELERSTARAEPVERLRGVLVAEGGWRGPGSERALAVDVAVGSVTTLAPIGATLVSTPMAGQGARPAAGWGIVVSLIFAFIGGMILNLMPCVLPIVSLKILGFVGQAGDDPGKLLRNGWVFAAGVVTSFWLLAGALLALRAGGQHVGWGFQLQSPPFLVALASLFFLFGLNLFGVFEIGTSVAGRSGQWLSGSRGSSAFLSGVLATVVATPCTAPFMGSALGVALTQPVPVALGIFTALGAGMATPYLILCAFPRLVRLVPKPGPWMEALKQLLGFLLMATVVWLVWVLGLQAGHGASAQLLLGLLVVAVGAWIMGRWATPMRGAAARGVARVLGVGLIAAGVAVGMMGAQAAPVGAIDATASMTPSGDGIAWESYDEARVDALRRAGTPVFIDFTAAWCLTCQVNERVVLNARDVVDAFKRHGVVAMKADWTSYDERVTQALARFGRGSVPLYVLYGAQPEASPELLPELLTPSIVLKALERAAVSEER